MSEREFRKNVITYVLGEDFTKEEYDKWLAQITLWISEEQTNEPNPKQKAKDVLQAAITGTKLNGEEWKNIHKYDLPTRIKMLCGYDIIKGKGSSTRSKLSTERLVQKAAKNRERNDRVLKSVSMNELVQERENYKAILYNQFPFLDNPVYEANVNALADATVKLEMISEEFLVADGKDLSTLLKVRESLKKDINDFQTLLRIHPSQVKDKVDEGERGDVGTLINKWEEFGEVADLYEVVDAVQEALQIVNQLENTRVDGSPQLADWLLWHKTGCRGHKFTCSCGEEFDLHGGFTKEEMYQIAEQAYETFGFGIKPYEASGQDTEETEGTEANG